MSVPNVREALTAAAGAMDGMAHQIEQMRGLFKDEDGTIRAVLQDYEEAQRLICEALKTMKPS